MIEFPFIGPSYPVNTRNFSSQRTVNLFPEKDTQYKYQTVLTGFPGDEVWTTFGRGPVRAALDFKDDAIVVSYNVVYKVNSGGGVTQIGALNTHHGAVDMDENGVQIIIVDGKDGWLWDGSSFDLITDPDFVATKADSVASMDGFFIVNKPGTGQIFVSGAYDGATWSASATAVAEFKSDNVTLVRADRELFLSGPKTVQGYYNSGASPMPFEAIRNARIIYGIAAKRSWVTVGNTSYFLGQDKNGKIAVFRLNGLTVERVSNRGWERQWSGYDYRDAVAFGVQFEGHEWYVLTFPLADHGWGRTLVYCIESDWWVEVGVYRPDVGDFGKHPMTCHLFFAGKNLFGDEEGNLREMRGSLYQFNGDHMISLRRSPVLHDGRERLIFNEFGVDAKVGIATPEVTDPQMMMRYSDDGGFTWRNQRTHSLSESKTNKYETTVSWRLLGSAMDRVFEVSISDNVERKLLAGFVR